MCIISLVLTKVEFSYKIGWRRSYTSHYCTVKNIQEQTVMPGEGSWQCASGCSGTLLQAAYVCTDYRKIEDWTQKEYTFQYYFDDPEPFVIQLYFCLVLKADLPKLYVLPI